MMRDSDSPPTGAHGSESPNAPPPDREDRPMWKRLVLPAFVVVALLASVVAVSVSSSRDEDDDRLPNSWEDRYGISTNEQSGDDDPDHDRLTNQREYDRDTNPRKPDTDGDGFKDGLEVHKGTDPRDRGSNPGFPTPATTGVPPGWKPKQVRTSDLRVTRPGTVVRNVLLKNADILVEAPNVTLRRVELRGGAINNWPGEDCNSGLVIEQSTIGPAPGQNYGNDSEGVVGYGGYTAKGVKISRRSEGFRASGCGPVRVEDSFALITPPRPCGDWHGDGLQGYDAEAVKVRNVTLELSTKGCDGTAPFFVPSGQGNTSADIERLLVKGGGYPFRLGVPGKVTGLKIADDSWVFGPVDVRCSALSEWEAEIVEVSPAYKVTGRGRAVRCEGTGT
jgi:Bacterial TSP3 repeat